AHRGTIRLVMNVEDDRHARGRRITQHTVINKSVCVRNPQARGFLRKSRSLRQIEVIGHERIDDMVGELLLAGVRSATRRTIPCFRNLQAGTHFGLIVRNVLNLHASKNRNSRRKVMAENLALIVSNNYERVGCDVFELVSHAVQGALTPRKTFTAGFDFDLFIKNKTAPTKPPPLIHSPSPAT